MTTVAELIAVLQQQPPDAVVVVDGYEGGFSDPDVHWADALIGVEYPYGGLHSEASRWDIEDGKPITRVVVVGR